MCGLGHVRGVPWIPPAPPPTAGVKGCAGCVAPGRVTLRRTARDGRARRSEGLAALGLSLGVGGDGGAGNKWDPALAELVLKEEAITFDDPDTPGGLFHPFIKPPPSAASAAGKPAAAPAGKAPPKK